LKKFSLIPFVFLLHLVIIFPVTVVAQSHGPARTDVLEGIVKDAHTGSPLPFVNLGIVKKRIGTVTDEEGRFSLMLNDIADADTLRISMIGYKPVSYALSNLRSGAIRDFNLTPGPCELQEIVVRPHHWKTEKLGNDPLLASLNKVQFPGQSGSEVGIPVEISKTTILERFSFYLMDPPADSLLFRLNIYSVVGKIPAKNLLNKNIYFSSRKGGWVTVDLSSLGLVVNEDIFIAVQYVKGYDDYKYYSGAFFGTKAWIRSASDSYWEETPLGAAMYLVAKN
jgi:hypothetical protein